MIQLSRNAARHIAVLMLCVFVACTQTGCADKQATLDRIDNAIAIVERSAVWMDATDRILDQVDAGSLPWTAAWDTLRPVVPDDLEANVDRVIAAGGVGSDALRDVVDAARADRDRALADLAAARLRVEQAEDPLEVAAAATEAGLGLVALIAGSGVITTAVGGVIAVIRAFKRGRVSGATETAAIVATGRSADPNLNSLFEGDTPASRAMKAALANSYPEVAKGIKSANANIATPGMSSLPAPAAPSSSLSGA